MNIIKNEDLVKQSTMGKDFSGWGLDGKILNYEDFGDWVFFLMDLKRFMS